jgi:hypothetical protein
VAQTRLTCSIVTILIATFCVALLPGTLRAEPPPNPYVYAPVEASGSARDQNVDKPVMLRAGWGLLSAGLTLVVGSGVLFGLALDRQNDFARAPSQSLADSGVAFARSGQALAGVGIVAAVAGLTMVLRGKRRQREARLALCADRLVLQGSF